MNNTYPSSQRGNALWFILIGVALLAALTIILSRSGSSVDQTGDFEQRSVKITQMLRYAKSIEAAVQEMKLRGTSENEISFQNTLTATDYTNANCDDAADRNFPDCMIFDVRGAGLTYRTAPESVNDGSDWIFSATNIVDGVGSTAPDLVMFLQNMRESTCTQINRFLNTTYAGTETGIDFTEFTGSYSVAETINLADGQQAGCLTTTDGTGNSVYLFYYVLLQR